ncbi:hypothetical protein C1646_749696 [Rhizophagus diaphanus]|nr:hypothetical protein C1646_749696 [Rhizophagus diaphanus] [Rhizophagus sp. MUCL 43196]
MLQKYYKCGATFNPENVQLWKDAETFFLTFEDFEYTYNNVQIANKWKNLVDNYKSSGAPIIIQYKDDIEIILNKDRPILNSKSCIGSFVSLSEKKGSDDI